MASKIKLNKNLNVGFVIFIVEGEKTEFEIIKHIFKDLFAFSIIQYKRFTHEPIEVFQSSKFENTKIAIINTENSSISSIKKGKDYIDKVYSQIYNKYGLDYENAAVYYIFDRDNKSNDAKTTFELLDQLGSSRDNGVNANGLLLLSYPCVEAFLISSKEEIPTSKRISVPIKQYIFEKKYQPNTLTSENIEHATSELILQLTNLTNQEIDKIINLDSYKRLNINIFNQQESFYQSFDRYPLLSMLTFALIDLNLIEITK
jgi:hypothetical protein